MSGYYMILMWVQPDDVYLKTPEILGEQSNKNNFIIFVILKASKFG